MKRSIFTKFILILSITIGIGSTSYLQSQTIVQWYTSMGDFRAELREDLVPVTGQNFIDLTNDEFYDDFIFHRVISGFMNQDGCPNGNGTGGPGYTFNDEFHPDLRHDEPGMLSMANAGPNTNGSQYFITVAPTEWLDDAHAVFGKIIDGMDVVYAISEVETNGSDKPLIDIVIDSIRVVTGTPSIAVTAPTAGQKWNNALENEITWSSSFIADVKIELSIDNGQTYQDIIASTSANTRSYMWDTPDVVSDVCLIRISDVDDPSITSVTENVFTICSLDLLSPNGFESFRKGSEVEVTWSQEFVEDLSIYYKSDEFGDWDLVEEGISASDESYMWTPNVSSNWAKIKINETLFPDVADESDFRFFVVQLDMNNPQGGENIAGNSEFVINWDYDIVTNVKIEFSSDNGSTWETISSSTPASDMEYTWTVPNIDADECYVRLSVAGQAELFTQNADPFSVYEVVGVNDISNVNDIVLSPNPVNDILRINLQGQMEKSKVEIYDANGQIVLSQENGIVNDGEIEFNLVELPSGIYFIQFRSNGDTYSKKFIKN